MNLRVEFRPPNKTELFAEMPESIASRMPSFPRLLALIALLCVFVLTALFVLRGEPAPTTPPATSEINPIGEALASIYFEPGNAELARDSGGAIQKVKEAMQTEADQIVLVSGFHDPSGDPEQNQLLARERALSAKAALLLAGVPEERIVLRRPEEIPGTEDMQEARRVDLRVQPRNH